MTTKTKTLSVLLLAGAQRRGWQAPPWTTKDRLERIESLSQRISEYVRFMCQVGNLKGTSAEAKENAVVTFHEHMVVLERQLGRIQADLQRE